MPSSKNSEHFTAVCFVAMVITKLETDPLHQDYKRLTEAGTKPNLAKLTIARKIAAIHRRARRNRNTEATRSRQAANQREDAPLELGRDRHLQ